MIIDDDKDDRFFFVEALAELDCCSGCIEACDGAAALKILREAQQLPDYIFLDVNMPRMNGRECLLEIKKDVKLKDISVIMYSTCFTHQSRSEFGALGAANYLLKPTDINTLPAQIVNAIAIDA